MSIKGILVVVMLSSLVGCAASSEDTAGSASDLSQADAYKALVGTDDDGKTFVSGGTSDCGHALTLVKSTTPNGGTYAYSFHDCETGDRLRSHGTFALKGGFFGGLLTDPTLEITPDSHQPDTTPWSYKVRQGDGKTLPKSEVSLESTSEHHAKLIPQGFVD